MAVNELIQRQEKELAELDKHVLPDTLNADEWQTFILSGFLNEYAIAQVNANIETLKKKIKELENKKFNSKKSILDVLFIYLVSLGKIFITLLCFCIPVCAILSILELIFRNNLFLIKIDDLLTTIFVYVSWPLRYIFNLNPIETDPHKLGLSIIPLALLQLAIILAFLSVITLNDSIKNEKKLEEENIYNIQKAKKELDDYLPIADNIKKECGSNLEEIYRQNLIPDCYHNYESLGMLYGYFSCKAAETFQDAAKEYLQDQRTNRVVQTMEKTNELLKIIAQNINILNLNFEDVNVKLNTLIEQNNRSILGKLFPNNPISVIYSKSKKALTLVINNQL